MARLLRFSVGGAGIGGVAALIYRQANAPMLPTFMTDAATDDLRATREQQTAKLHELLRDAAPAIDEWAAKAEAACGTLDLRCKSIRAAARSEHTRLRNKLRDDAAALAYGLPDAGASAAERDAYVLKYGCVAWTDEALAIVASRGPIVEVGAGMGQWARALRTAGANVAAYDDGSALPTTRSNNGGNGGLGDGDDDGKRQPASVLSVDGVTLAVDGAVAAAKHPDRALLMVAPPPGPSANRWLASYKGKVLLYAGEGRGGASADEEFFASIEKGWRLVAKHTLKPFPGGAEQLWVLERQSGFG